MRLNWKDNFRFWLWNNIQTFPYFLIKKWQKIQTVRLVKETYLHVPMYQIFWNEHGIFSGELKKFDIKRFPIITKKIIRTFGREQQLHNAFSEDEYEWHETSGSTGEPFRFVANPLYSKYFPDQRFSVSARHRFLIWNMTPVDRIINLKLVYMGCHSHQGSSQQYLFIPISEFNSSPEMALQKIIFFKPEIIEGMTTLIEELARCAIKARPTVKLNVAYVLTTGEKMTEAQRRIIEKAFNCEAFNIYGMEEIGFMATECRFHCGLHIAEESYLIEILDSDGNLLPDGVLGRIVITSFFNDLMPFIRYDTGDEGMIIPKPCACGLNSRLLVIQSRRGGYLTVGNIRYNTVELTASMDEFSDTILRYQIIKTGENDVEIRIIPVSVFTKSDSAAIVEKWRKNFSIAPKIVAVDSLTTNKAGKTPIIVEKTQSD